MTKILANLKLLREKSFEKKFSDLYAALDADFDFCVQIYLMDTQHPAISIPVEILYSALSNVDKHCKVLFTEDTFF